MKAENTEMKAKLYSLEMTVAKLGSTWFKVTFMPSNDPAQAANKQTSP